jgi:hypothetical protein
MTALRWLTVALSGIALLSWSSVIADIPGQLALTVSFYCAVASLVLLVTGIIIFRREGLWLAIPALVAVIAPVWIIAYMASALAGNSN